MAPDVSVVVATHNRARLLPRLMTALSGQTGVVPFEVVVVDDASTDDTWSTLQELARRGDVDLQPVHLDRNGGPAVARNAGWHKASGEIVCFTDDDCVPQPDWLAQLVAGSVRADIVQGRTLPNPEQLPNRGPFSRTIQIDHEQGLYETCNILYPRRLLEELGGFDEAFLTPNGEDVDLAWRARERGATTTFAHDALVLHDVWPSEFGACLREVRRCDGMVFMFRRHPQLRATLQKGVFYRPTHWAVLLAAATGTAALARPTSPARLAAAATAGAWYAWQVRLHRARPPRKWQWAGVVPAAAVVDLAEVAVFARASLRHRTLML